MKLLGKIVRLLCILHLLLGGLNVHTQELKEKQVRTLSSLGLPLGDFDLTEKKINTDFQNILKLEKRRRGQKIAGSILLPVGLATAGLGVSLASKKTYRRAEYSEDGTAMEESTNPANVIIGSGLFVIGATQIGVSIPMFVSSAKKKRKRNRLLYKYAMAAEEN